MRYLEQIYSYEHRREIAEVIRSAFGENLSQRFVGEWTQMIINEADLNSYEDYFINNPDSGAVSFAQYGKKEFYHDGSCEPRKIVCITSISEEEYIEAKKKQCMLERESHEYRNGWLERGDERFFTYWEGRSFDYIYYTKNLSGIAFVKITIERLI